jgi:hypothetical protein
MRVTICGHAGLLVETADCRALIDPLFADSISGGAIGFAPGRRFDVDELGPVTHLVVSHGHPDHFHPATLTQFSRETPVVVPTDVHLIAGLRRLGFDNLVVLDDWQAFVHGGTTFRATPSDFAGEDEMGVLVAEGASTFWDTVDTIITPALGERLASEHGPIGAVAARYQPADLLVSYQRTLGASFDYKPKVVDWLEAACATQPRFAFPYSFGVTFLGPHAWANRYAAPLAAEEVARLLQARLGSPDRAAVVQPGDIIDIDADVVTRHPQASRFVRAVPADAPSFEPVDLTTIAGLDDPSEAAELRERLERYFVSTFQRWLRVPEVSEHVSRFAAWDVVWQLVVHLGGGERLHYVMDFRRSPVTMERRCHPEANYFVHIDGGSLLQVLRGEAGTDLFWRCGAARYYEKIFSVRDGRFWIPPVSGWELYQQIPDPFTLCLRKVEEGALDFEDELARAEVGELRT